MSTLTRPPRVTTHNDEQQTLTEAVTLQGKGLFSGVDVTLTIRPAPADHGVIFARSDLKGEQVPALVRYVVKRPRRTALRRGEATVETVEHCMSALAAMGVDNALVEVDAAELPAFDGSALPFIEAMQRVGLTGCGRPRRVIVIDEPLQVHVGEASILAVPTGEPRLDVVYEMDYDARPGLGRQLGEFAVSLNGTPETGRRFAREIAPARTFCLEEEALAMQAQGMGTHLTPQQVLVFGKAGPLGDQRLRFADEAVRHKILDVIGDLYLAGAPIHGRVIALRSGHPLNHMLVRQIVSLGMRQRHGDLASRPPVLDIRKVARILPHRYPMLLVDRVIEFDGDRRALGVKNVTINEPFFQGHYPTVPIMPGVLVVEAMAQLSGVLIGQKLEQVGKLAVLLSLDRVKLRKPVTPGDQLVLEAETVRIRSRIAHMRCRAFVADEVVAEAEVKFMLVDDEQE